MPTAIDVMTTKVITVAPDTPVTEIADTLLKNRISAAPVVDTDGNVIGMVSEGDLLHRMEMDAPRPHGWWLTLVGANEKHAKDFLKAHGKTAAEVMTTDVISVTPETPLAEIAATLESHHIKRVPVIEEGKLVGLVSRANLVRALGSYSEERPSAAAPEDRSLRAAFLERAHAAGLDSSGNLNVIVEDGAMHIWGYVQAEKEADALRRLADEIPGVKSVKVELPVYPVTLSAGWV